MAFVPAERPDLSMSRALSANIRPVLIAALPGGSEFRAYYITSVLAEVWIGREHRAKIRQFDVVDLTTEAASTIRIPDDGSYVLTEFPEPNQRSKPFALYAISLGLFDMDDTIHVAWGAAAKGEWRPLHAYLWERVLQSYKDGSCSPEHSPSIHTRWRPHAPVIAANNELLVYWVLERIEPESDGPPTAVTYLLTDREGKQVQPSALRHPSPPRRAHQSAGLAN